MGFVSPAGRVRGRRRAAPSAFVVAAAGLQVAEGRALRADTKRRGAPFTKARVRGTRKCSSRSSKHENASPPRSNSQLAVAKGARPRIITDFELGGLVSGETKKNSALNSHFTRCRRTQKEMAWGTGPEGFLKLEV